ncbi:MAG: response regulator transcription factor [Clostridiales bacterium]|nr:response regulator transcription factor [Clostridiales bacterium]
MAPPAVSVRPKGVRNTKKLIYAADDEENIRVLLKTYLEQAGFDVCVFPTGDLLLAEFQRRRCDFVVLDIMMPGTDGLEICRQIREISKVPIIILTAKESEVDYVMGLTLGGDDYIIKPFRPSILVMRIKALMRRMEMEHDDMDEMIGFGDITYSGNEHAVLCRGKSIGLTITEVALLRYMMKNASRAVPRDELLNEIWGISADVETRVTDETIRRIRKKLKIAGCTVAINAVWGYGYRLEQCP